MEKILKYIKTHKLGNKYCIVTDTKVEKLYGLPLKRYLGENGIKCELISFPNGEKFKNLSTVEILAEKLIEKNFDRKDALIAVGGGVVGDMTGFLASIYMRGIPYIQVPTTLLAMVDSSIGGKTGVDLKSGKNLIGSFYQPSAIFVDIKNLKTLSRAQIKTGLAEIIKCAVTKDKKLFRFIEQNIKKILSGSEKEMNKIIARTIEIKEEIVKADEKENDQRIILNYGHTYGHTIEKLSHYRILHGHAIAIGMVLENKLAVEKKLLSSHNAERIKKLLIKAGLPVATIKKPGLQDLKNDKKRDRNFIKMALPTTIGKTKVYKLPL